MVLEVELKSWITLINLINDPVIIIDKSSCNKIVQINDALNELWNDYGQNDLLHKDCQIQINQEESQAKISIYNLELSGLILTNKPKFLVVKIKQIEANPDNDSELLSEFIVTENGEIKKIVSDQIRISRNNNLKEGSSIYDGIHKADHSLFTASVRQALIDQIDIERLLSLYDNQGHSEEFNIKIRFEQDLSKNQELLISISKPKPNISSKSEYLWENALFNVSKSVKGLADKFVSADALLSLNKTLNADYTFLAEYIPETKKAKTLFVASKQGILDNFEYALAKTPCELVKGHGVCIYDKNVQQIFPEDLLLVQMGIESYAGVPVNITAHNESTNYILVSLFKSNMSFDQSSFVKKMLLIFSVFYELEIEKTTHVQHGIKLTEERHRILEGLKEYAFLTSHELRAPLTNLLGLTQSENFDFNSEKELKEYINCRLT